MGKIYSFFFLFLQGLCVIQPSHAQSGWELKENGNWAFVSYSGVNFTGAAKPMGMTTQIPYRGQYINGLNSAAVSDRNGKLLFYTDMGLVWNRDHQIMPNGDIGGSFDTANFMPDPLGSLGGNTTQGVLILPVLNNPNQYYIFALNGLMDICNFWLPHSHKLLYSVVDMSLNGGLGDVVSSRKNVPVDSALGAAMVAVYGNDCNIWLLVRDRDSVKLKAYEITVAGINPVPVSSYTGNFGGDWGYKWGEMQISGDRKKIAISSIFTDPWIEGGVELGDFDANTGTVSNAKFIDSSVLSVCFSPDNRRLYYTSGPVVNQCDLTLPTISAIIASSTVVADSLMGATGGTAGAGLRLGIDGKIYTTSTSPVDTEVIYPFTGRKTTPWLGVIDKPNTLGVACNYIRKGVALASITDSLWQGPYYSIGNCNAFVKPIPADSLFIRHDTIWCSTIDSMLLKSSFASFWYEWDDSSVLTERNIKQPGTYWVRNNNYCHYRVDTFVVKYVDVDFNLGPDTTSCDPPMLLHAHVQDAAHLWSNQSKDTLISVDTSGVYWLQVSKEGCVNTDTIHLRMVNVKQQLGQDLSICTGTPIQIKLRANVPNGASALWNDNTRSSELWAKDTGTYWVRVTDPPCEGWDDIHIATEWCDCALMIPSAFSPNGDGINDWFVPQPENPACNDLGNYSLSIFNRFGQRVFTGRNDGKGWNGLIKGKPAETGTYMYIVEYSMGTQPKHHVQKGDVVLIR